VQLTKAIGITASVTMALLALDLPCDGQTSCQLPRSGRDQVTLARATVKATPGRLSALALEPLAYLEYACPEGAASVLRTALASVSAGPDLDEHTLEDIAELKGLLAVTEAVARGRSGQRSEARATLLDTREKYASERVQQQGTLWLADLLLADGKDPLWSKVEADLGRIAEIPGPGWMAKNVLVAHWSNDLGAAKAFAHVQQKLGDSPGLQDSLELTTISVRLLLDLGRDLDAAVLVANLDPEVGRQLLDPRARIEFLRVAAEAWKRQERAGFDPNSSEKSRIYAAAYQEALR
jgi:hypothetical protein